MFDVTLFPRILEELNAPDQSLNQFSRYHDLLVDWNRRINLISKNDIPKIWERHFMDSLALIGIIESGPATRILDLGSGAGFPGLPVKIIRPAIEMILLDSVRKKVLFLNKVIETLGLHSTRAVLGRAEEAAEQIGKVDAVVSRGVASAFQMLQWAQPYLNPGGRLILLKGADGERELDSSEIRALSDGGKIRTEFRAVHLFDRTIAGSCHYAIIITNN